VNNSFGFENPRREWNTLQQLWILGRVGEGHTQQDIYDDFTAEESPNRPPDIERWGGTFGAFKKRVQRLTKNGVDPAIDTNTGQKCEFDLATARGRYDYWVWLAKTTSSLPARIQALQMIEKLALQHSEPDDITRHDIETHGIHLLDNPHIFVEMIAFQLCEKVEAGETEWVANTLISWVCSAPALVQRVLAGITEKYPIEVDPKKGDSDVDESVRT